MFKFDNIRQFISKKRKPPQKRYKQKQRDLELLKFIKIHLEHCISVIIHPPSPQQCYDNAKAVKKVENLSDIETLIKTGFWVEGE
jgi:hypothetical protein